MSIKQLGFVAALTLVLALALPQLSSAGAISGTWDGAIYLTVENFVNAQYVGSTSTYFLGQMSLVYDPAGSMSMTITTPLSIGDFLLIGPQSSDPFGTNSASGTVSGVFYPDPARGPPPTGDFFVTYRSILPDGSIDTSTGTANGDIIDIVADTNGTGQLFDLNFATIPEPPSIVPAAFAFLIIGSRPWTRGFRPRPRSSMK
jgi:hypothetical protein